MSGSLVYLHICISTYIHTRGVSKVRGPFSDGAGPMIRTVAFGLCLLRKAPTLSGTAQKHM